MTDIEDLKPTIPHAYLTEKSGGELKFYAYLDETCPQCQKGFKRSKMALYTQSARDEVIHCVSCDHQETRPRVNRTFRPMNSGRSQ